MIRFFTADLWRNIIKTVCLTIGLAIGFLLVAKVYMEESYDTFLPDCERLYILTESVEMNGEYREYNQTAGAIAPAIKRYSPLVEAATRFATLTHGPCRVQIEDGKIYDADRIIMADSCFFDVLQTEIIAGDPHEVLSVRASVMIPESLAKKLGEGSPGEVVGKELRLPDGDKSLRLRIGGVYKDYPLNSSLHNAVYLSLESIGMFMYDGRDNWIGNDMYSSIIRLAPGCNPSELQPYVTRMLRENIDSEDLEMSNYNIGTTPLIGNHNSEESVKTMTWILSLLAVVMLMCAGLNYLLITIGQTGKRSKEMAVRKCYGTPDIKIFGMIMGESVFFLGLSMGLAILLIFCFPDTCQRLLGYTPGELLSTGNVWIAESIVCLAILAVTGVIPAWIYCRTPVAHSFSTRVRNRRFWKLSLLSLQFMASAMLLSLLVLVGRQFHHVSSIDMGIEYENLGVLDVNNVEQSVRRTLVKELESLSCVEGVSSAMANLIYSYSGNNVWTDDVAKQVNVADMYYANSDIIDVAGMRLLEGTTFYDDADSTNHQVIVEKKFADVLEKIGSPAKTGTIVGSRFKITGHEYETDANEIEYTICGVVGDMKRGGFQNDNSDPRAAVFFPAKKIMNQVYIRFNRLTPENLQAAQDVFNRIVTDRERYILPYLDQVLSLAEPVKRFGLAVMVIGIAILVIAMIGLIGYTTDEVQFRSKEVAIRKVTGFTSRQITGLFIKDILRIALPSTIAGGVLAIPLGSRWISQFSDQTGLAPAFNILCIVLVLVIIVSVVTCDTMKISHDNPVKHLHRE